jgi:hypothetical protein
MLRGFVRNRLRLVRLLARMLGFHPGEKGSKPLRGANMKSLEELENEISEQVKIADKNELERAMKLIENYLNKSKEEILDSSK